MVGKRNVTQLQRRGEYHEVGGPQLTVLIADQDGLARAMMRNAVREANPDAVVHTAADAREVLQLARYYRPRVIVVETGIPPKGGVEVIRALLTIRPETRVLTVSVDDHEAAIAALRAGAVGHITKDIDPDELARFVERAAEGEPVVPEPLLKPMLQQLREVPESGWRPLHSRLTTREWEIVEMLQSGASTDHIADRLVLSPTTVYSHVKSLLRKLGVHSREEAVQAAEELRRKEVLGRDIPNSTA